VVSRFGWIDFSEKERREMLDVIKLFRQQDTVDELGIGTIRDAFANYFFPGTSTIQTRAKYFLLIPWIYQEIELKQARRLWSSDEIGKRVNELEKKLIYGLIEGGETDGVIGIQKKEKLQRFPSSIYWSGLGALQIRLFNGSQREFHRTLSRACRFSHPVMTGSDGRSKEQEDFASNGNRPNWNPGLPKAPGGFLNNISFKITFEEAEYLRERVIQTHRNSLFAVFLLDPQENLEGEFLWDHPLVRKINIELQSVIEHARRFSETMHGAALLYNLMLAEKRRDYFEEKITDYSQKLETWGKKISARWPEFEGWFKDSVMFWKNPAMTRARIPIQTRSFVTDWLSILMKTKDLGKISQENIARELIDFREKNWKGKRARLHNNEALSRWEGASGTAQLAYRWGNARRILLDIYKGLAAGGTLSA
jgi:hypothetical protein